MPVRQKIPRGFDMKYTPPELIFRLRQNARNTHAGSDSLLIQAADTIEAQERQLRQMSDSLFLASQAIAALTLELKEQGIEI